MSKPDKNKIWDHGLCMVDWMTEEEFRLCENGSEADFDRWCMECHRRKDSAQSWESAKFAFWFFLIFLPIVGLLEWLF